MTFSTFNFDIPALYGVILSRAFGYASPPCGSLPLYSLEPMALSPGLEGLPFNMQFYKNICPLSVDLYISFFKLRRGQWQLMG